MFRRIELINRRGQLRDGTFRIFLILVCGMTLAGCDLDLPVSSKTPLSERGISKPPPDLVGDWYGRLIEKMPGYLHIRRVDEDTILFIFIRSGARARAEDFLFAKAFGSEIDDGHFLNLYDPDKSSFCKCEGESLDQVYLFLRYDFSSDGAMRMAFLFSHALEKAVSSGGFPPDAKQRIKDKDLGDLIANYIREHGSDDLFKEHVRFFRRVQPPHGTQAD